MTLLAQSVLDELNRIPYGPVTLALMCGVLGWWIARQLPRKMDVPSAEAVAAAMDSAITKQIHGVLDKVNKIHVTLFGNGGKGELARLDEEMKRLRDGRHDFVNEISEVMAKYQIETQRNMSAIESRLEVLDRERRQR